MTFSMWSLSMFISKARVVMTLIQFDKFVATRNDDIIHS